MAYKSKHTGQEIDAAVDDAKKIGALVRDIGDLQAKNVQQDERLDTAERSIRDNSDGLVQARGILSETQGEVTQVKNELMNGVYPMLEGYDNHLATIDKSLYANTEEHKQFKEKHAEIEIKMSRMDEMIAEKAEKAREYTIVNEGGDLFSMDKIVYAGTYRIKGEHTRTDDGLPLAMTSGGYTVDATLTVLNSSLENGTGEGDDYCVTQILSLSNRVGGDGNVYVRTAQSADGRQWTWEPWGKLQTNIEVGQTYSLDVYTDNGIYSGVYTNGSTVFETFVMIVINNYAVAGATGNERIISQLKYAVNIDGTVTVKKRIGKGNDALRWGVFEDVSTEQGVIEKGLIFKNGSKDYPYVLGAAGKISTEFATDIRIGEGTRIGRRNQIGSNIVIGGDLWIERDSSNNCFVLWDYNRTLPKTIIPYGFNGKNITKVTWNATSNMNDFKEAGVYDIYGERTVITDNMPILNTGSGHSIAGRLTVVVSTLQPDNNEKCITQFLMLSNRLGGDGGMYIRTYNENNSPARDWWSPWQKLQGVKEGYIYTDTAQINPDGGVQQVEGVTGLCNMVDNGIYSGIYVNNTNITQSSILETFTLIVINDYAAVGVANQMFGQETLQRQVCQLKYATDAATGTAYIKKRTFKGNNDGYKNPSNWSDWEDIGGGGSNEVDITDAVKAYGLPTLVGQGLAKEGVTYKVICNADTIPTMDSSNKIAAHIRKDNIDSTTPIIFKISVMKYSEFLTAFIDCYIHGNVGKYYKYVVSNIFNPDGSVKVSSDMTVL
jgi:hypothetical protein